MCAEMHLGSITHACGWLCCNQMLTGVAAPQAARPEMEVLMKWLKERQASAGVSPPMPGYAVECWDRCCSLPPCEGLQL